MKTTKLEGATGVEDAVARALAMRPRGGLARMNFDAAAASSRARLVLETIEEKVPDLVRLPGFEPERLAELRSIAELAAAVEAAWEAEKNRGEGARREMVARARSLRRTLVGLLPPCLERGVLSADDVRELGLTGDLTKLPDELRLLANLFLLHPEIGLVPKAELEAAVEGFGALKLAVVPDRERTTERRRRLALARQLVFAVLMERYEGLRLAIAAILHEDPTATETVRTLVPSLITRRPARPRRKRNATEPSPA